MLTKRLVLVILFAAWGLLGFGGLARAEDRVLYIPLDERPVNLDYVVATTADTLYVVTPPDFLLPDHKTPAPVDRLWDWAFKNARSTTGMVLATDTLIYGGLIPSRNHELSREELLARAENFKRLKALNPRLKILAFTTLMRTPAVNTAVEEPAYYGTYGAAIYRLTALEDKKETRGLDARETMELAGLKASIPPEYLQDWLDRRAKNLEVTSRLLELTREGVIDYLVLGRDDASAPSQSHREYRYLLQQAGDLTADRFISFPGVDEGGLVLLTRLANLLAGEKPGVYLDYAPGPGPAIVPAYEDTTVGDSVAAHIAAAGGRIVTDPRAADLVLMVNTPPDGVTREAASPANSAALKPETAAYAKKIATYIAGGRPVALADIAFANGADNSLLAALEQAGLLSRLQAYAGLNTAGNAIGYALCQGLLARRMQPEDRQAILAVRLLDDWGYQANVRGQVDREIIRPYGVDKNNPGAYADRIFTAIRAGMARFARAHLGDFKIDSLDISFPWNRAFNIGVKIR
ncbi:hypothetical protein MTBGP_26430 [Moorella thermoacetica]|uniref:DUF4127 family protein n=1 Tax=Neomoorella thermoacetica TaxID=1525 RepID=UPI0030CA8BD8